MPSDMLYSTSRSARIFAGPTLLETDLSRITSSWFLRASCAILSCAAAVPAATAQQPAPLRQPETVPFELATALASAGGFAAEPQILVGEMPEWISKRLYVPSNARVLGSALLGTTVVGIISIPSTSDSLMVELRRELMKKGWSAPPPPPAFPAGGFRPAVVIPNEATSMRATLCADQQMLVVSAARRRGTVTDVTFRALAAGINGACHPQQLPASMVGYRSPYPTLYNPQDASDVRMSGDCSTTMGGSSSTGTTLRTAASADALLDHYARQLQDSGWKSLGEARSIVGRVWSRPDSTGAPVELSLTVMSPTSPNGCRDLNMQVRTLRKP
jgi:hypothetical protein